MSDMNYSFAFIFLGILHNAHCQQGPPKPVLKHSRSYMSTLKQPLPSEAQINNIQLQFLQIAQALTTDLLAFCPPAKIQKHLDDWENLKTPGFNMQTVDIDRVRAAAQTAYEIAKQAGMSRSKEIVLHLTGKAQFISATEAATLVQAYIDAQQNYDNICNHLGIKRPL